MEMRTHDLKIWPEHFNAILGGLKAFEVRVDDRGFEAGDFLCLREWEPYSRAYTGRELTRRVTCLVRTAGPVPLPDNLVVLGLEDAALAAEQARLGALLHQVAELLGVPTNFGAVEEEALLAAAREVQAVRKADSMRSFSRQLLLAIWRNVIGWRRVFYQDWWRLRLGLPLRDESKRVL